ncbi:malate/L-lactate dehydrogenase [Cadophora sp. DSE1049]|nr:malate/L-lactate dehydrogenase [Cadophora sp. DSE1049]
MDLSGSVTRQFYVHLLVVKVEVQVPSERAELIADALVLADLRGVDTHGINRLPSYIARIQDGALTPNPDLEFELKTPVMALLDAKNTFGFVTAALAIDKGIEMASTYGLAVVSVKHSNHYGMAATFLCRAVDKKFAAFAFTNASRSMPPWGSKEPLFGTSPFAVGLPGGKEGDFMLDMSPSVAARGKIRKVARRGESIQEGYALDEHGRPTTDAEAALRGVVLPIGGPKGSGLAMMMDILAAFRVNVGHWFLVFRPEVFLGSWDEYVGRMDELMERVRACEKAEGVDRIYTSGEIEANLEVQRRKDGIPYTQGEIDGLHTLSKAAGSNTRLLPAPAVVQ